MAEQKKSTNVSSTEVRKAPRRLVPRTAPKADMPEAQVPAADSASVNSPNVALPPIKKGRARKELSVDETVAKHQAVLADALKRAQAINYDQPVVMKQASVETPEKPSKAKKCKLVRDSYAMPETEYAQIGALKKRMAGLGSPAKKSELLRGGIALLAALSDAELKAVMGRVERIKTGRPAK